MGKGCFMLGGKELIELEILYRAAPIHTYCYVPLDEVVGKALRKTLRRHEEGEKGT